MNLQGHCGPLFLAKKFAYLTGIVNKAGRNYVQHEKGVKSVLNLGLVLGFPPQSFLLMLTDGFQKFENRAQIDWSLQLERRQTVRVGLIENLFVVGSERVPNRSG